MRLRMRKKVLMFRVKRGKVVTAFSHYADAYAYWRVCLGSTIL